MMWNGAGGWWMALWMVLFWGGLVVVAIWGVRALSDTGRYRGTASQRRGALEILEERFARGEVDAEEFEQRRAALERR